jgi:predicted dienelactone hydrolase
MILSFHAMLLAKRAPPAPRLPNMLAISRGACTTCPGKVPLHKSATFNLHSLTTMPSMSLRPVVLPFGRPLATLGLSALLVCMSLLGCSTTPQPKLNPEKVQRFEAEGYPFPHEYEVRETEDSRLIGGQPAELVWTQATDASGTRHPLIICMPGLGQNAHALMHLRRAWAAAGYDVLSWQPLPADAQPDGDHALDHMRHTTTPLVEQRAQRLADLMVALRQAQSSGYAHLAHTDLDRVGLVGYDIGALTAQFAAGEELEGSHRPAQLPAFSAYILISPYASFELGAFGTRYRAWHAPMLLITSDSDVDSLVTAAYLRTAPFGSMPAGHKYMLLLRGTRHASLGETGEDPSSSDDREGGTHPKEQPVPGPTSKKRGKARTAERERDDTDEHPHMTPTLAAMQRAAVAQTSTAFLDAQLQADSVARQWLSTDAVKWIAPVGDWLSK